MAKVAARSLISSAAGPRQPGRESPLVWPSVRTRCYRARPRRRTALSQAPSAPLVATSSQHPPSHTLPAQRRRTGCEATRRRAARLRAGAPSAESRRAGSLGRPPTVALGARAVGNLLVGAAPRQPQEDASWAHHPQHSLRPRRGCGGGQGWPGRRRGCDASLRGRCSSLNGCRRVQLRLYYLPQCAERLPAPLPSLVTLHHLINSKY